MTKKLSVVLLLVLVMVLSLSLVACNKDKGKDEHTHTFSDAWSSDADYHWHAATCKHTEEVSLKAAHTWNDGVITTPQTETVEGIKTYTCTVCGKQKTENLGVLGHTHTYATEWSSDDTHHWYAATCEHTELFSQKAVHTWNDGVITTPQTETVEGIKTYTCTVCGKQKNVNMGVLGHTHKFATEWSSDDTYHWYAATCGHDSAIEKIAHTFGNVVVDTNPTLAETGTGHKVCSVCSKSVDVVIPKISIKGKTFVFDKYIVDADDATNADYDKARIETGESTLTNNELVDYIFNSTYKLSFANSTFLFSDNALTVTQSTTIKDSTDSNEYNYSIGSGNEFIVNSYNFVLINEDEIACELNTFGNGNIKVLYFYSVREFTYSTKWENDSVYHYRKAIEDPSEGAFGGKHIFDAWIEDTAATVISKGSHHRLCKVCGYREDGDIDPIVVDVQKNILYNNNSFKDCPINTTFKVKISLEKNKNYVLYGSNNFDYTISGNEGWKLTGATIKGLTVSENGDYIITGTKKADIACDYVVAVIDEIDMYDPYCGDNEETIEAGGARAFKFALNSATKIKLKSISYSCASISSVNGLNRYSFNDAGITNCVLPATGYYMIVYNTTNAPADMDATIECCHSTLTYKGKCENCEEEVCNKVLTAADHGTDVTFTPYEDKIYFNFRTIAANEFYIDTETQQNLTVPMDKDTPSLIKSIKLYDANGVEVVVTRYAESFYYYWESNAALDSDAQYYCVITLDENYVDLEDDFVCYFEGIIKIEKTLEFTTNIFNKEYDGNPLDFEAQVKDADPGTSYGTIEYWYKVDGALDSTYTQIAPVDAGDYVVKVLLVSDTYSGQKIESFTITKKTVTITSDIHVTYSDSNAYSAVATGIGDIEIEISCNIDALPGTYNGIYNGYNDLTYEWTMTVSQNDDNYTLDLTSTGAFTLVIDKIALDVDGVLDSMYYNSVHGYTDTKAIALTEDMCSNEIDATSLSGVKIEITYKPSGVETIIGLGEHDVYGNNWVIALASESPYYTLNENSSFTLIVYSEDISSSFPASKSTSIDVSETKIYKVIPTTTGIYGIWYGENDFYSEVLGEDALGVGNDFKYYRLEKDKAYYLSFTRYSGSSSITLPFPALTEATDVLSTGFTTDSMTAPNSNYYYFTCSQNGIYEITTSSESAVTVLSGENSFKNFCELEAGETYIIKVQKTINPGTVTVSLKKTYNKVTQEVGVLRTDPWLILKNDYVTFKFENLSKNTTYNWMDGCGYLVSSGNYYLAQIINDKGEVLVVNEDYDFDTSVTTKKAGTYYFIFASDNSTTNVSGPAFGIELAA